MPGISVGPDAGFAAGYELDGYSGGSHDQSTSAQFDDMRNDGAYNLPADGDSRDQRPGSPTQQSSLWLPQFFSSGARLALPNLPALLTWTQSCLWLGGSRTGQPPTNGTVGPKYEAAVPVIDASGGLIGSLSYPFTWGVGRLNFSTISNDQISDVSNGQYRNLHFNGHLNHMLMKLICTEQNKQSNFQSIFSLSWPIRAECQWFYRSFQNIQEYTIHLPDVDKPKGRIELTSHLETDGIRLRKQGSLGWVIGAMLDPERRVSSDSWAPPTTSGSNPTSNTFISHLSKPWQLRLFALREYWKFTICPLLNQLFTASWQPLWAKFQSNFASLWLRKSDFYSTVLDKFSTALPGSFVRSRKGMSKGILFRLSLVEACQKMLPKGLNDYVSGEFRLKYDTEGEEHLDLFHLVQNPDGSVSCAQGRTSVVIVTKKRATNQKTLTGSPSRFIATPFVEGSLSTHTKANLTLKATKKKRTAAVVATPLVKSFGRHSATMKKYLEDHPVSRSDPERSRANAEQYHQMHRDLAGPGSPDSVISSELETTTQDRSEINFKNPLCRKNSKYTEKSIKRIRETTDSFRTVDHGVDGSFCNERLHIQSYCITNTHFLSPKAEDSLKTTSSFTRERAGVDEKFKKLSYAIKTESANTMSAANEVIRFWDKAFDYGSPAEVENLTVTEHKEQRVQRLWNDLAGKDTPSDGDPSANRGLELINSKVPTNNRTLSITGELSAADLRAVATFFCDGDYTNDKNVVLRVLSEIFTTYFTPHKNPKESTTAKEADGIYQLQQLISHSDKPIEILALLYRLSPKTNKTIDPKLTVNEEPEKNVKNQTKRKDSSSSLTKRVAVLESTREETSDDLYHHKSAYTKSPRDLQVGQPFAGQYTNTPTFSNTSSVYQDALNKADRLINDFADGQSYILQTDSIQSITRRWAEVLEVIGKLNKTRVQFDYEKHVESTSSSYSSPREAYCSRWKDSSLRVHRLLWPKGTLNYSPLIEHQKQGFFDTFIDAPFFAQALYPLAFFLGSVEDLDKRCQDLSEKNLEGLSPKENAKKLEDIAHLERHRRRLLAHLTSGLPIQEALYPWPVALPEMELTFPTGDACSLQTPMIYPRDLPELDTTPHKGQKKNQPKAPALPGKPSPHYLESSKVNHWFQTLTDLESRLDSAAKRLQNDASKFKQDLQAVKTLVGTDKIQAIKELEQRYRRLSA